MCLILKRITGVENTLQCQKSIYGVTFVTNLLYHGAVAVYCNNHRPGLALTHRWPVYLLCFLTILLKAGFIDAMTTIDLSHKTSFATHAPTKCFFLLVSGSSGGCAVLGHKMVHVTPAALLWFTGNMISLGWTKSVHWQHATIFYRGQGIIL